MDIVFNLARVPFDGVQGVTLVISILGSGGGVAFVRVVVPIDMSSYAVWSENNHTNNINKTKMI